MKRLILMCLLVSGVSVAYAGFNDFQWGGFTLGGGGVCKEQKPGIVVTPTSHAFGNQSTNTTRSTNITLTNSGNATLTDIVFQPFSSAVFTHSSSATAPCGTTLAAKTTCYRKVSFTPTAATTYNSNLVVASNQLDSVAVAFSGAGINNDSLYTQTFNTTGVPSGWTYTGSANFDYTQSPAPIGGTGESLLLPKNAASTATYTPIGDRLDIWVYTEFINTANPVVDYPMSVLQNSSGTDLCQVSIDSANKFRVKAIGGTSIPTSAVLVNGTRYYVKYHYIAGIDSNAQCIAYVTSTAGNWGTALSSTNGTGTTAADRLQFRQSSTNDYNDLIIDNINITTSGAL